MGTLTCCNSLDATSTDRSHYSCGNRISVFKNDPYSFPAPRATRSNSLPTCFSHIKNDTIQDSFALPLWDYGQPTARVKAASLVSGVNIYVCNIYAHCYNHLSVLSFSPFSLPSRLLVFLLVIITYLMSFYLASKNFFHPVHPSSCFLLLILIFLFIQIESILHGWAPVKPFLTSLSLILAATKCLAWTMLSFHLILSTF